MEWLTPFVTTLGPVGVFCVVLSYLYLRYAKQLPQQHQQNAEKLDHITTMLDSICLGQQAFGIRLTSMEIWQKMHDETDQERYQRHQRDLDELLKFTRSRS